MQTVELYKDGDDPFSCLEKVEDIIIEPVGEGRFRAVRADGEVIRPIEKKFNDLHYLVVSCRRYNNRPDDGRRMVIRMDKKGDYYPVVISRDNHLWDGYRKG